MVSTTCHEISGISCKVELKGSSLDEFTKNIMAHAEKDHHEMCIRMSPQQQQSMREKIQSVYKTKSTTTAGH